MNLLFIEYNGDLMITINRDELVKNKGNIKIEQISIDNIEYDALKVLEILVEIYLNEIGKNANKHV